MARPREHPNLKNKFVVKVRVLSASIMVFPGVKIKAYQIRRNVYQLYKIRLHAMTSPRVMCHHKNQLNKNLTQFTRINHIIRVPCKAEPANSKSMT